MQTLFGRRLGTVHESNGREHDCAEATAGGLGIHCDACEAYTQAAPATDNLRRRDEFATHCGREQVNFELGGQDFGVRRKERVRGIAARAVADG